MKQLITDLKGETDNNTVTIDFNNPLSAIDGSTRQKINKKILELNRTLQQMD